MASKFFIVDLWPVFSLATLIIFTVDGVIESGRPTASVRGEEADFRRLPAIHAPSGPMFVNHCRHIAVVNLSVRKGARYLSVKRHFEKHPQ